MALVNLSRQKKDVVKGEEIAGAINRYPGTIRNQMQSLRMIGVVEGVPGPKGGYKTTAATYKALGISELEKEIVVPIRRNGKIVENTTASEISFITIMHPRLCNALVKIIGDIRDFDPGDMIHIGPTPVNKLMIMGEVMGRDDNTNSLLLSIKETSSLPKNPVKNYIGDTLITVPANASIQEASRILIKNNIHGAPVSDKGEVVGIVSLKDIGKVLANGNINVKIRDVMSKNIIEVDGNTPLYEVVRILNKERVGRLLVRVDGKIKGVISRTDVLRQLASLF